MLEHVGCGKAVGSPFADFRQAGGSSDSRVRPDAGLEEGADDDRHPGGLGKNGDIADDAGPSDAGRLDHQHVGRAGVQGSRSGLGGIHGFVQRDRDAALPPQLRVSFEVTRPERLLDVLDVVGRHGVQPLNRHRERPAAVGVEPEPDRRGNDVSDRGDAVHQGRRVLGADLELEAGEPFGYGANACFGGFLRP